MTPENIETKPVGVGERDVFDKLATILAGVNADKTKQQTLIEKMAREAIEMSDGNRNLQEKTRKMEKDNPAIRSKRILEEKATVKDKVQKINDKLIEIESTIDKKRKILSSAHSLPDNLKTPEIKKIISLAEDELKKIEKEKEGLIELKAETEKHVEKINQSWKHIDAEGARITAGNDAFAIKTVADAYNAYGSNPEGLEVNPDDLGKAVVLERQKEEKRKEEEEEKERQKEIETFIEKADKAIEDNSRRILDGLDDFQRRIEDTSPEGVKAKIANALAQLPKLLAQKTVFGFKKAGTHKDFPSAEYIYSDTKRLVEALEVDFASLSPKVISDEVSRLWNENQVISNALLPKRGGDIVFYNIDTETSLAKIFQDIDRIKEVGKKITSLSKKTQERFREINLKSADIGKKLSDPKEGLLVCSLGNTLAVLDEIWRSNIGSE